MYVVHAERNLVYIDSNRIEGGSIIVVPPIVVFLSVHEFNFAETVCSQIETNSRAPRKQWLNK
jgi:hypothetical protein